MRAAHDISAGTDQIHRNRLRQALQSIDEKMMDFLRRHEAIELLRRLHAGGETFSRIS